MRLLVLAFIVLFHQYDGCAGGTHGVSLFVKDRELRPAIVKWLQAVMK
jgi:hypothetical protein